MSQVSIQLSHAMRKGVLCKDQTSLHICTVIRASAIRTGLYTFYVKHRVKDEGSYTRGDVQADQSQLDAHT